jgi:hypothetical protein
MRILCKHCLVFDEPKDHQCDPRDIADHRRFWARQTELTKEQKEDLGP